MNIVVIENDEKFYLDIKKLTEDAENMYHSYMIKGIPLPDGRKLVIDKKSMSSIFLTQIATIIIIPMFTVLFASKGEKFEKPPKHSHEDIIDYAIIQMIRFLGRHSDGVTFYVTTATDDTTSIKDIKRISTTKSSQDTLISQASESRDTRDRQEGTGG